MNRAGQSLAGQSGLGTARDWAAAVPAEAVAPGRCARCEVRENAICAPLSNDELGHLERAVSSQRIAANATLIHEGDPIERTYTVLRGMLRVVLYLPDGRRHILEFLTPGDTFDFDPGPRHHSTVEAVVDSDLCSISQGNLAQLGARFPALKDRVFATSCRMLRRAHEIELTLARRTPPEKLAAFLIAIGQRTGRGDGLPAIVRLPMNRSDIADHLGLTIETVSRTLTRLRNDRLIRLPASHLVEILNADALLELAGRS